MRPRPTPWALALLLGGCFGAAPSKGGGQVPAADADKPRRPREGDVQVPPGYRIDVVARGLTFPTGVAFDESGRIYVTESGYSYGEVVTTPRIVAIDRPGAAPRQVAAGRHAPWTGLTYHDGAFFVAQGGALEGGRIVRLAPDGKEAVLVEGLPSTGDHHTNGPIVVDGWLYFGQGTATNSGVVGEDSKDFGWLARHPEVHDVPCQDVTLAGTNFRSANPLTEAGDDEATTGAFQRFGVPSTPGQVVEGAVPCSGAVMRVRPDGGPVELVAWGFRNPFGLAAAADGTIFVSDNGADVRGSRPIFGSADVIWKLVPGAWYGWPDYSDGRPLTMEYYAEADGEPRGFVLAEHPGEVPSPVTRLGVHSSADGFDISRGDRFGHAGDAFVALFGDMAPTAGKVIGPVGFKVVRVDLATGVAEDFARNVGDGAGPASRLGHAGLERPIAARFDPAGEALYVVDFGVVRMTERGAEPREKTGALWRITRTDAPAKGASDGGR